ncbi:MAG: MarR family winged helix-turn-helix transcriptional regulator [Pseudomonadota bacterium]|nr:MarR family winged helix-turn-helix transcriptional regulator [Pseudomonadota bacterium]
MTLENPGKTGVKKETGLPNEAASSQQLGDFLPYQLSIASNMVSALIAERYRKRFGLKIPEWRVMAVLGDATDGDGSMTQRALTEVTLMDKVAVNRACKVLEERGLVGRVPNASDGRSHLLALTQEGRAIHAEVMPLALATEKEIFDGFSEADRKKLRTMLDRLRQRVTELGGDLA